MPHRFCVPREVLSGTRIALPEAPARQVARVLRMRPGERIVLFCGDGTEWLAVLEEVAPALVTARLEEQRSPGVELACRLGVGLGVLKGEKLDWVVQKLTELGAARIGLLHTERTVVIASSERWPARVERLRRIAREAAEQCGRVRIPEIGEPVALPRYLLGGASARRCFLDPGAGAALAERLSPPPPELEVLVGPEGGFTAGEVELLRESGAEGARLGARILRAETAAVAAASVVAALLDGPAAAAAPGGVGGEIAR